MGSWAWDTRNETSYEETLHVVAFNCAYYVCLMNYVYVLCFVYLAIWAGIVSGILEMGRISCFRVG